MAKKYKMFQILKNTISEFKNVENRIKKIELLYTPRKLTVQEHRIIQQLSITTPYTFAECRSVYFRCKSYDKTISVLNTACELGESYTSIEKLLDTNY